MMSIDACAELCSQSCGSIGRALLMDAQKHFVFEIIAKYSVAPFSALSKHLGNSNTDRVCAMSIPIQAMQFQPFAILHEACSIHRCSLASLVQVWFVHVFGNIAPQPMQCFRSLRNMTVLQLEQRLMPRSSLGSLALMLCFQISHLFK